MNDSNSVIYQVKTGNLKRLKELLKKGVNPDEREERGRTPLHWAAQEGYLDVTLLLLNAGADVNSSDIHGFTPLSTAAGEGHQKLVKTLLRAGANPDLRTKPGDNGLALHLACAWNNIAVVKVLAESGRCDINIKDKNGKTPLMYAMESDNPKIIEYLIKHGAIS